MLKDWTFGRKVAAGFAIAGLVLLLVALFGYQSTHRLIENDVWVRHTYQVRLHLSHLSARLTDAETGKRGYLLTGDDAYLAPYQNALAEVRTALQELRSLTADNPAQQRRIDQVQPVIERKFAELARTIELRRARGLEEALAVVRTGEGRAEMDTIRIVLGDMDHDEVELLERRRSASEQSAASTKSVILWGSAGGLALIALLGWWLTRTLSDQIGSAVGHMHSSSAELQTAANQQASGAKEQTVAMAEVSTTISELLATSRQIAESAQRVAALAEETTAAAGKGGATVSSGHESIAEIRRQVDQIVAGMLELGRKSQRVGAVLDIVSELAEQTNILAINATIEAAGAGEAGRRFGVVADEIRKLADRVAGSTKEIRALIEDVRGSVNATVMTTEAGSKAVDAGARQFAEVAAAFKQIVGLVAKATEAAREIELSTKQQSTAVEQVNVAIGSVAQTTRETEASAAQTLQTASQLSSLSSDLLKLVQPQAA